MVELWYYTREGKQMDPVSIWDLQRLVGDGVVKPTDMVWKEGLPRWIRASSMKDLFPDPSSALDQYFSRPAEAARIEPPSQASAPAPTASTRPRSDDEEPRPSRRRRRSNDAEDEDRDRPRRRRPAPSGGGSGTKILIGILVGGFVVLASFVIGIIVLAMPRRNPQPRDVRVAVMPAPAEFKEAPPVQPPPLQVVKDDSPLLADVKTGSGVLPIAVSLAPGAEHLVKFRVKANHPATITVTPLPVPGKRIDLNMQVFKESDNALVVADETPSPSASVAFTLPATEIVRVRVHNASKKTTVTQFTFVYDVGK